VYESPTLKYQARKDILDTQASIRHHVGFLRLNREHRHNTLTPNYIKNIRRSLDTLNVDEIVKVIYMTGGKGEHFSNGTDFRTLLHYKTSDAPAKVASYLEDLYGL
jgi:enoyl-CoA hydratase/carnithine racemase